MSEELQQAEQASASLSAGFNKVRGTEEAPPAEVTTPEPSPAPEPAEAAPKEDAPVVPAEPSADDEEIFPGMTKGQAKELLAKVPDLEKANRRLNGKIGELVGVIKQNQTAAAQPGSEGAPARKLQADAFKRLQSEYPDLADALSEDMAALMPQAQDPKQVEELVSARVNEALEQRDQKQAARELKKEHKDWETVVVSSDFKLWLQTKPEAEQETFATTWDPDVVGGFLSQFKSHRDSLTKQRQRSTARLEGAVVPKGDGGAATSKLPDSAGLSAGFRKVRPLRP
jgi:hypothetical protein